MLTSKRNSGFTIVELIMTILILSIATAGVVGSLSYGLRYSADAMPRAKTVALAQAYFDEIMAKRYDETTPLGGLPACSVATIPCTDAAAFDDGEVRSSYDDVDDFHGLDERPPRNADGMAMTDYDEFRVQIAVRYPDATETAALGIGASTDAKLVSLTVTTPDGDAVTFGLLRANF